MKREPAHPAIFAAHLAVAHAFARPLTPSWHLLTPLPPQPGVRGLRTVGQGAVFVMMFFLPALVALLSIECADHVVRNAPLVPATARPAVFAASPAAVILSIGICRYSRSVASVASAAAN